MCCHYKNLQKNKGFGGKGVDCEILSIFIIGLFISIFILFYTFSANIHGDGFRHVFISEEILRTGQLLNHMPYRLVDIKDGKLIYEPISYPQTFYVLLSIFIMFFGKIGPKILPSFLGMLTFMFIYLLFRDIYWKYAIVVAILGVLSNSYTFIGIYPRIEEYLLVSIFVSIFYLYKFIIKKEIKSLIIGSIFLGLSLGIKQQSIYLLIISIIFSIFIYLNRLKYRYIILLILLVTLVSLAPLHDLIRRNGTIEPVPSSGLIPLFKSKYPVIPESHKINIERIYYWPRDENLLDIVLKYILYLIKYQHGRYLSKNIFQDLPYIFLFAILMLVGVQYLKNKNKIVFIILSILLITEIIVTYVTKTPVAQYHQVGIVIISSLIILGLFSIYKIKIFKVKIFHITKFLLILVFVIILVSNFTLYEHKNFYKQNGRYTEYAIKGWKELAKFAENNIPNDAIVLTGSLGFSYYVKRTTLWFDQCSNPWLFKMLTLNDVNEILCWLNYFNIDYIFIDKRLVGKHLGDSFPNYGLVEIVDKNNEYFKKIFSYKYDNKEIFVLYKINYPKTMKYCNKIN